MVQSFFGITFKAGCLQTRRDSLPSTLLLRWGRCQRGSCHSSLPFSMSMSRESVLVARLISTHVLEPFPLGGGVSGMNMDLEEGLSGKVWKKQHTLGLKEELRWVLQ